MDASTGTAIADVEPADAPAAADAARDSEDPRNAQDPQDGQDPQGLAAQRARFLVQRYLEDARELQIAGQLEEAKALLLRARELMPANDEVLRLLAAVNAELEPGGPATGETYSEQMQRLWQIREARARAEAQDRLQQGQEALRDQRFDEAVQQFRRVLLQVDTGPDIEWGDVPERARSLLQEAEEARERFETERQAAIEREILAQRRAEEEARQARLRTRVEGYLESAVRAFETGRYELAQDLAYEAMQLDPSSMLAKDLHNTATKALRDSQSDRYIEAKRQQFIKLMESNLELKIPQSDILRTDPVAWELASARGGPAMPEAAVSEDDEAVLQEVSEATISKVQFTEETGDYMEVVTLLRTVTGIPIIVTPEASQVIADESLVMEIDVVSPVSVANFLDLMTGKSENLAWTVRNGVVEITTRARAGGDNVMVSHDVRDLVFPRTSFLPPVVRDIPTGETAFGGGAPRIGGEGDEKIAYIEPDQLQINIQSATGEEYWDTEGGGTIDWVESGYLLVYANPEMQQRVAGFLDEQRRFAASVVTIETRFLTITQNFLQEFGVDFRGLGGSGNKGTEATLDDITNFLDDNASRGLDNQGTGDPAGHPSAGAFFNDGGDGDIRGRTEHFFGSPLGRALSGSGGATAAITILDDLELQALIRAIEQEEDVQVVNSQLLSVLNNERANMAVINQTSYIRDFDVEVAQASFIADPKVDVIQDGIVLDVRPTIAHDRKHVMLSLQPTVAELTRPIPTFTTSLAGTTLPVTLQLPTLTVRSFATTASVPDGGSVLIGGLREVLTRERRAEVPILGRIPIVSFLFKQEGVADETTSLAVLVRATITELSEVAMGR